MVDPVGITDGKRFGKPSRNGPISRLAQGTFPQSDCLIIPMRSFLQKLNISLFTFLLNLACLAQSSRNDSAAALYRELESDERSVVECVRKQREHQLSQFGKVRPKISGHCWSGCPTLAVLRYYPPDAEQLNIKGQVKIEAIVNENGKVVYAKIIQGKPFIGRAALKAASLSTYTPKVNCEGKPIKFRWLITYNFF